MLASPKTSHLRATLIASALVLAACNGGVAFENLPEEYASAFCDPIRDCTGDLGNRATFGGSNCNTLIAAEIQNGTIPLFMELMDRGTVGYDEGAAATCFDEISNLGCDIFIAANPAVCSDIFVGTIELGGTCGFSEECAGDAYCDGAACPTTTGTCVARKANGAACDGSGECVAGLVCEGGTCGAPASRSGGSCGGPEGNECPLDETCVGDTDETAGTCTPLSEVRTAAMGEACDAQAGSPLCQPGLSCALVAADATGTMFECRASVSAGGACFIAFPSMCPDDQYCNAMPGSGSFEGTCVALPTEGQACATGFEGQCAQGLFCVGADPGTCMRPKDNGASCADGEECYSGICEGGVCAAPEPCAG